MNIYGLFIKHNDKELDSSWILAKYTLLKTSTDSARSYIFLRFEARNSLSLVILNLHCIQGQLPWIDNTSYFVSPVDFDGVEVILEQL